MLKIRNRQLFVADIVVCFLAYVLAAWIMFPLNMISTYLISALSFISVSAVIHVIVFVTLKIYYTDWVFASVKEYTKLLSACLISCVLTIGAAHAMFVGLLSPKFYILEALILNISVFGMRCFARFAYKLCLLQPQISGKRTLVIGAGRLSVAFLRDLNENVDLNAKIIGLIDDDLSKENHLIYGVKVLGNRNDIERVCRQERIEEIIFAIYNLPAADKTEILNICSRTGRKVKILVGMEGFFNGEITPNSIREVEIEDLLERDPIKLDNKMISTDIEGNTVLVTGGGGSIGSELCRQIIKYKPGKLIILDIYENTTYELQNELEENYPAQDIDVLIASVRDKKRLENIFRQYKPDMVFHAAAHKHVPLMEYSPSEAIKNNVFGTYNVARCANEYGVKKFIMISTDKAVNPTNVMGATKRMCEMIIQTFSKVGKTEFVAVRFGNVLGSNGSVIPRFKKQIAEGGPVTVTHPEITRFFMTIPEAAQLVLQAAAYAKGGEIFVLDMGQPVKIYDLAKKMIFLSGYQPDVDVKIEFTGLRPGEKLYEELLMNEEGLEKTAHSKIFVGQPIDITMSQLEEKLRLLEDVLEDSDIDGIKNAVAQVVPTYNRQKTEDVAAQENSPEVVTV